MSHVETPIAPSSSSPRARGAALARPVSFSPAPRHDPGFSLRGDVLFPAVLTMLSFATRLVGGRKDELR